MDENGQILPAGEPDMTQLNDAAFRGCFGGGPGRLSETSGRFLLNTGLMVPNTTFVFTVQGQKDSRVDTAVKNITLQSPAAPVVTIE